MKKKTLPPVHFLTHQSTLCLLCSGSYSSRTAETQDSTLVVL